MNNKDLKVHEMEGSYTNPYYVQFSKSKIVNILL